MARRGVASSSLFPFMSVLACTIGALVVLLAVLAVASVEGEGARAQDRSAEGLDATPVFVPPAAVPPAATPPPTAEARAVREAESRWQAVEAALVARGLESAGSAEEIAARIRSEGRTAMLAQALDKAEAEARRLARVRGSVESRIEGFERDRETLPILIDSTGLSPRWRPYFVECDAAGITAYRVRDDFEYFVAREALEASGDFARYLQRVRAESGALLVLLVRDQGLGVARTAGRLARELGVRVARLPLPGDGALDWSLLRKAEGGA